MQAADFGMIFFETIDLFPPECRGVTETRMGHHDDIGIAMKVKPHLPSIVFQESDQLRRPLVGSTPRTGTWLEIDSDRSNWPER
jgi:hypothetical protein